MNLVARFCLKPQNSTALLQLPWRLPGDAMRLRTLLPMVFVAVAQTSPALAETYYRPVGLTMTGILLVLGFIALITWLNSLTREKPAPPPKPSDIYGTAAWAEAQTALNYIDASAGGLFLGQSCEAPPPGKAVARVGAPIFTAPVPPHHTLIVGSTRTGKGTRVIIPTLLRYAGSVFVVDPKGENAAVTARTRRDMGHAVHIINPWGVLQPHFSRLGFTFATYNPLDVLDRHDDNIVGVAESLADAICVSDGRDVPYFREQAASLLSAILLYLTDHPEETKTLARVREIVGMSAADFKKNILVHMMASSAFDNAIKNRAGQFDMDAKETYAGITSNLNRYTRFIDDLRLKAATRQSTFRMIDIAGYGTAVYLVIPPEKLERQGTWLRLLLAALTQTYKEFETLLPKIGAPNAPENPNPCLTLIDELPALGRLNDLPKDIALIAAYGIRYALIVQGMSQLKAIYGEDANTILANCACQWYCNVKDLESARTISEKLGDKTVVTKSTSTTSGTAQSGETSSSSTTMGETGRRLLQANEVLQLGRDAAIALMPEGKPMYLRPIDYWKLEAVFAGYRQYYPKLFWDPPLAPDPNPYAPRFKVTA